MRRERKRFELDILNYVAIIRYEKIWFFGTSMVIMIAGMLLINAIPPIYTAQSEILLEQEGVFASDEAPSKDSTLSYRMHTIIKTMLTKDNIQAALRQYGVIEQQAGQEEIHNAIQAFRNNTQFKFENVDVVNAISGREGKYSLGLVITHDNKSRDLAYKIVQRLTELLLNANRGKVSTEDERRMSFLQEQFSTVLSDMKRAEAGLVEFKRANALYLPEVHSIAIRHYEDLESRLKRSQETLQLRNRRENEIRADLASSSRDAFLYASDGKRVMGPEEKLLLRETELASKSAKYSQDHPEIVALETEIDALKRLVEMRDTSGLEVELNATKEELVTKKDKYSNEHPDIIALRAKIKKLGNRIASAQSENGPHVTSKPNNPAYVRLASRLEGARDEIYQEERAQEQLINELKKVEDQIQRMPYVAQKLQALERTKDLVQARYDEVKKEFVEADLAKNMREANLLDRFVLLEPPVYPVNPSKPKKKILFAVLLLFALSIAYLVAMLMYRIRDQIHTREDLVKIVDAPVYMLPKFK